MYGNTARSMSRVWLMATATAIPRTMAMASPMNATLALDHRASRIVGEGVPVEEPVGDDLVRAAAGGSAAAG